MNVLSETEMHSFFSYDWLVLLVVVVGIELQHVLIRIEVFEVLGF